MADAAEVYNSVWQLRSDSWCRLEDAAEQLRQSGPDTTDKSGIVTTCRDLLGTLARIEPYWAFPGPDEFARAQRLFAAGSYDKFARAVTRINRALITESYRTGDVDHAGADEPDLQTADALTPRQPAAGPDRPYFEVLVVEAMTEDEQRALRKEVRGWRRPDDEFVYDLVVVPSPREREFWLFSGTGGYEFAVDSKAGAGAKKPAAGALPRPAVPDVSEDEIPF